ncbi:MAG: hypothetical protein U9R17_00165 [Thermodesulfobacteriota bacterium]|nr:hypothetical protein [Thermodesulfobacteriota bacterium]
MKISIDTCILLDLLLDQNDGSIKKLRKHHDEHDELIICGMVYGELYPIFEGNELNLELFLLEGRIKVETCNNRDYAYAGKKWKEYCRRRRFVCPVCGKSISLKCPHCDSEIRFRQHILSDFIIGSFSELHCDALLTRDYGYYKTYFPKLKRL